LGKFSKLSKNKKKFGGWGSNPWQPKALIPYDAGRVTAHTGGCPIFTDLSGDHEEHEEHEDEHEEHGAEATNTKGDNS